MAGGAEIIVHGSEMDEMPAQNVISIAGTVNGASVVLPLPALTGKLFTLILVQNINHIYFYTENDQFNSNGNAGKIAYKAPSVMSVFSETYSSFDGTVLPNGTNTNLQFDA